MNEKRGLRWTCVSPAVDFKSTDALCNCDGRQFIV